LHVLFGVLIRGCQQKLKSAKLNSASYQKVLLRVVLPSDLVSLLLSLHKATTHAATILVANLINLNCVVSTVEGNYKETIFIVRLS